MSNMIRCQNCHAFTFAVPGETLCPGCGGKSAEAPEQERAGLLCKNCYIYQVPEGAAWCIDCQREAAVAKAVAARRVKAPRLPEGDPCIEHIQGHFGEVWWVHNVDLSFRIRGPFYAKQKALECLDAYARSVCKEGGR